MSMKTRVLMTLLRKEWLELLRSYKLIWVPLVFLVLGIMQPVSSYYMPLIIEKAGNMPEGTIIEIPMPSEEQVLAETLSQFGLMGLLILALSYMGIVSAERASGAASLVLVKPISFTAYMVSKWLSMLLFTWGVLLIGYGAAWYYTWLLFDKVELGPFLISYLLYGLWFSFILSATLLFSTLLRSAAGAACSALGLAILLSLLGGLLPKYMACSPGALTGYAYEAVQSASGSMKADAPLWCSIGLTAALVAACLMGSAALLRRAPAID
ncbi:ABC transporter permease subunit [Paenibacillus sp. PL2-23]|uniref:ABC transporter permease n=1 Tax=Paenibacillus sp. PL2-23 TaxID=2100729 RepID=UPI0030FB1564